MASLLNSMQKWPLMMLLDHGWYLGVRGRQAERRQGGSRGPRVLAWPQGKGRWHWAHPIPALPRLLTCQP